MMIMIVVAVVVVAIVGGGLWFLLSRSRGENKESGALESKDQTAFVS